MGYNRKLIRHYAKELLKEQVDVGGRVYVNRPSPIFLEETPCVLVYPSTEQNTVISGDEYNPKVYQRNLILNTDVLVTEQIRPDTDYLDNQAADDLLDDLCEQVEKAFHDDWYFFRLLKDYDSAEAQGGLLMGMAQTSTTAYVIDTDGERRIVAQRITWDLPYEDDAFKDKKWPSFNEFYSYFMRVGWDENTVDPILREAKGTLEQ